MSISGHDEGFERQVRELFDASVEQLDAATCSRLTRSRHAALAAAERPRIDVRRWLPAGAIAAAGLLALSLWMLQEPAKGPVTTVANTAADDFELMTSGEDLDMLNEDAEFYSWAMDMEARNGAG